MNRTTSLIVAGILFVVARPAAAQSFQVNIDENGGGSYFGPIGGSHSWGGFVTFSSPPVYHLNAAFAAITPPGPNQGLTPGDVVVNETATAQISSDLLRFDVNGNLTVFSDRESSDVPPFDLADVTSGVPTAGTNAVFKLETDQFGGPPVEGRTNGLFGYSAAPGTPGGFSAGSTGVVTYNFISDTPEPSTFVLALCGALGLIAACRSRVARITQGRAIDKGSTVA